MSSALDRRIDAEQSALVAPGAPLAVGETVVRGQTLPVIATAPPSLPCYFAHYCAEHAALTFLVAGRERLSFAEVHAVATATARTLVQKHGIRKGERIGIAMRNSPAWIVLYMAALMAGGVATLLNGWWQSDEIAAALGDVECTLIFADAARAKRLGAVEGLRATVIAIDDTRPIGVALGQLIADAAEALELPEVGPQDDATILFTSGSTGRSKGAVSDHRAVTQAVFNFLALALVSAAIGAERGEAMEGRHAALMNVPLFHVTGMVPMLLGSFAIGRKLVLMPKWDAKDAMRLIEAERVTSFTGVPLMSFEILTHPDRAKYDLSTVTYFSSGGAPRPVEHVRRIDEEMGDSYQMIGYGLTETNAVGAINFRENYLAKPASTGRASKPLVDIRIIDGSGCVLPAGRHGEIGIRSVANFREYCGQPEATAAAFSPDGYFLTGDLGYLDEEGYLFVVDRKKDIIIRGGENISCAEVESALYAHPAVAEAAVFALPDERLGEVPGAVVHPRAPDATEASLREFLGLHLAAFCVPVRIWIVPIPLPRLGSEKIDKVQLRRRYRHVYAAENLSSSADIPS